MGLLTNTTVGLISALPRGLVRRLSSRYIAGEELPEAVARLQALNADGFAGILDILGEDDGSGDDAAAIARARSAQAQYVRAATELANAGVDAYVSAKPTHFGLRQSEELCFELYDELARHCAGHDQFLRVEMEDHPTVEGTLCVFERLLTKHANVGIVIQSRLFRTGDDLQRLIAAVPSGHRLQVRMVKGIYLEPAEVAHTEYQPIADAYVEHTRTLWEAGARVSLATHDDVMQPRLEALRAELGIGPDAFEYQVLMGVRPPLWRSWQDAGLPVRVYVPYGPDWHAYSMRRLKKNPKLLQQMALGIFAKS